MKMFNLKIIKNYPVRLVFDDFAKSVGSQSAFRSTTVVPTFSDHSIEWEAANREREQTFNLHNSQRCHKEWKKLQIKCQDCCRRRQVFQEKSSCFHVFCSLLRNLMGGRLSGSEVGILQCTSFQRRKEQQNTFLCFPAYLAKKPPWYAFIQELKFFL